MAKPSFAREAAEALGRVAVHGAVAIAVAALAACSAFQAPAPDAAAAAASPAARDPILLGHAAWCGTNPPSGYCPSGFKR